eukprot:TRINITY_DN3856_c0_g1_i2.p1 TRINITY_DN3856_c0_g1~~TRINITY_DN3856_c0_g1_i2.p1  ORF type:complete len:505 (-),score=95.52 TRINITY_DN3856_c0_g1_i2:506-2020(-)
MWTQVARNAPIAVGAVATVGCAVVGAAVLRAVAWGRANKTAASAALQGGAQQQPQATEEELAERCARKLAAVIRHKTVTGNFEAFAALRDELRALFPLVHLHMTLELVEERNLMYTWKGSNPQLSPVVLHAHQDVVPVTDETLEEWKYPPFDGTIADGFVWGRGALDDKGSLVSIMEACEMLLAKGFSPIRTLILVSDSAEETTMAGGKAMATLMRQRGVAPAAFLDEGCMVLRGLPLTNHDAVALVGVAEKSVLNVRLEARATGGHSSCPPPSTSVGVLARAITRIEATPMPLHWQHMQRTIRSLGGNAPFSLRLLFGNAWLFSWLLARVCCKIPSMNASCRTTFAVTMCTGSPAHNVMPETATANVNVRMLPGDTPSIVAQHIRRAIADPRVRVELLVEDACPATISSTESAFYRNLCECIQHHFGRDMPTAAALGVAGSDSRNWQDMCPCTYRFSPYVLDQADLTLFHGINERLSCQQLGRMSAFYESLITGWCNVGDATN